MGSFVLSKIKRWKGSLIRIRPYSPADTIVKPATIEEDAADADGASSSKASSVTIVAYESYDDESSSLSSIHTGSLTSFAGNLSPPEMEFHEDLRSGDDNKKKDEDTVTPPSKSKTDIVTPAKKTIRTAIIGRSIPIPSIISSFSSLMDDINPTVENGQEINDEENTVTTLEIIEGVHPCDSMMLLFGGPSECIDTFKREEDDAEEDDEGNQFVFESEPQETGTDVTGKSTASNSNGAYKSNKGSDKVGSEIIAKKRYQAGSVVKNLNALYKTSKKGVISEEQLSNKPSFDRSIEKEEVDLIAEVIEIEICRMGEQSMHTTIIVTDRIDNECTNKSKMTKSRSLTENFIPIRKQQ